MARVLGTNQNQLKIDDQVSGSTITFFYRLPTTKERQGYMNMAVQRKGKRVEMRHAEAQAKYGEKILTGIRDGDFEVVENGKSVPLSSDPKSPHYREDWKQQVADNASDLLMLLAIHAFDRSATIGGDHDEGQADDLGE